MPRPSKPPAGKRGRIVSFRLTDAEFERLQAEAAASGLSVHEHARIKTGGASFPRLHRASGAAAWPADIARELIRVGNNMNQIARALNLNGHDEPRELKEAGHDLHQVLGEIMAVRSRR